MIAILGVPYFVQHILLALRECVSEGQPLEFKYFSEERRRKLLGYWKEWKEEMSLSELIPFVSARAREYPLLVSCEVVIGQIEEACGSS